MEPEAASVPVRRDDASALRRDASFAPATFNEADLTVEVVWSTGARVERFDWMSGERFVEELSLDPAHVDLTRLNGGAPLLNSHRQWGLDGQIGVVERAWLDRGEGRAVVRFSSREDVAPLIRDIRDGVIRNLSVGYSVQKWVITDSANGAPKVRRAEAWQPAEISFVPIPADPGAQVRSAAPAPDLQSTMETRMEPNTTEVATEATVPAITPTPVQAETTRAAGQATLADLQGFQARGQLDAQWVVDQLARNATVEQARDSLIDALALRNQPPVPPRPNPGVMVTRDERDTMLTRMVGALVARMDGRRPDQVDEASREFVGIGLHGMMRELAVQGGIRNAHRLSIDDLLTELTRNSMTTSDFNFILLNSTNKRLRDSFGFGPNTWSPWCAEYEVPDFKTITSAAFTDFPEPGVIAEDQEIPLSSLSDTGEQFAVQERAVRIALSRRAIVNDDLRAFDRAIASASLGAYTALRRAIWGVLTTGYSGTTLGQTMADTHSLVKANHNNIGTTGALASGTFSELRRLLSAQAKLAEASNPTPVPPPSTMFLLVGPLNERTALELTSALIVPTAIGNALPEQFRSATTVIQDGFLGRAITGLATEPYFLARGDIPPVEVAYLQGYRTPQVRTDEPFTTTGMQFRVEFPFRAYATEWRSIAGNVGTAS